MGFFPHDQEKDLERTVGINTGHVNTEDLFLEAPDQEFVIEVSASVTATWYNAEQQPAYTRV